MLRKKLCLLTIVFILALPFRSFAMENNFNPFNPYDDDSFYLESSLFLEVEEYFNLEKLKKNIQENKKKIQKRIQKRKRKEKKLDCHHTLYINTPKKKKRNFHANKNKKDFRNNITRDYPRTKNIPKVACADNYYPQFVACVDNYYAQINLRNNQNLQITKKNKKSRSRASYKDFLRRVPYREDIKEKKHVCPYFETCGKFYGRESHLGEHFDAKHPELAKKYRTLRESKYDKHIKFNKKTKIFHCKYKKYCKYKGSDYKQDVRYHVKRRCSYLKKKNSKKKNPNINTNL